MKSLLIVIIFCTTFIASKAQQKDSVFNIYDIKADPVQQLNDAMKKAQSEHKHILFEIGGNWCVWCKRFNAFTTNDKEIDSVMNANFVVLHINYSKENKNLPFMRALEFPQRFGFPVFVIMDANGRRLHTQNSAYLEAKETYYDRQKIIDFLKDWQPSALDPKQYEK
jgi:thioredoxin-related protein